jgi:hypothetical protein
MRMAPLLLSNNARFSFACVFVDPPHGLCYNTACYRSTLDPTR